MSWFSGLLGLGGSPAETVNAVADGLDGLFTSDDERLSHEEVMERLRQQPSRAQVALNAVEAQHRTIFIAGWRPFTGWVCGLALAYQYLINPMIIWVITITAEFPDEIVYPPTLDMSVMMPVLLGMLGLGTLRTVEKSKQVTK